SPLSPVFTTRMSTAWSAPPSRDSSMPASRSRSDCTTRCTARWSVFVTCEFVAFLPSYSTGAPVMTSGGIHRNPSSSSATTRSDAARIDSSLVDGSRVSTVISNDARETNDGVSSRSSICCTTRSPSPRPVASRIAMRCSPPPLFARMRNWRPNMPKISSGPRIVPMRNALEPTASVNSRLMTGPILDMDQLLLLDGRLRTDTLDEDLLERRLRHLEAAQADPAAHEVLEERLRVRAVAQCDLELVAVLAHLPDVAHATDRRDRVRTPVGEPQRDVLAAMLALDLRERAVGQLRAPPADAHVVADALRMLDDVRAEDDRAALRLQLRDDLAQDALVDRIETTERLVQDDDLGVVQDRADELDLLLHPLRQLLHLRVRAV